MGNFSCDGTDIPFLAVGSEALEDTVCRTHDMVDCPHCGGKHELTGGRMKREDGTWEDSNVLLAYRCDMKNASYLYAIEGKKLK